MTDLKQLFLTSTPLIDVRAPIEFQKGAFPCSTNIPILNDEHRHQVGTCYQERGPEAAETLGYDLVSPTKDALVEKWKTFIASNPNARLYCFRGGKRSQIAEKWLKEAGSPIERIEGGYKKLRNFLLEQITQAPEVILLSGKTGVGKTELLPLVNNAVDLEGLANHRGSAFGGQLSPQPSQIDFENALAIDLLRHKEYVVLEDESRLIGRIHIPPVIQEKMKQAPICLLEDSVENRATRILQEYVLDPLDELTLAELQSSLTESLSAIQRRLGGARYKELKEQLQTAFQDHMNGNVDTHRLWIETLLVDYYDPMYEYQLDKKRDRIKHRINWAEVNSDEQLNLGSYCS